MENLKEFPTEFSGPFRVCFDLLAKSNIRIYDTKPSFRKYFRYILLLVMYVTFYFSMMVSFSKVFSGELGFYELANLLPIVIVATQGAMKGIIIITHLSRTRKVINDLGNMWRIRGLTEKQMAIKKIMLKRLKLINGVFYWMNIIGTWQYILVPLCETLFRTFILHQDKLLFPFICTFPFDSKKNWIVYLVTYFYESYSMVHLIYMYLGVEFLLITLCSHLATEFELLREELLHVKPEYNENDVIDSNYVEEKSYNDNEDHISVINEEDDFVTEVDKKYDIKDVIRRHQKLIALSEQLDEIFNKMIFFNLLFATITICFFGFVAKIARDPPEMANNFVGVIASMIPIFNLCYYAELLTGASLGVADSAYHNIWYRGNIPYQKTIMFIILRSQKACSLTSMKYATVTLNTFTTVLSTTWSYFSLAISVYESDK